RLGRRRSVWKDEHMARLISQCAGRKDRHRGRKALTGALEHSREGAGIGSVMMPLNQERKAVSCPARTDDSEIGKNDEMADTSRSARQRPGGAVDRHPLVPTGAARANPDTRF